MTITAKTFQVTVTAKSPAYGETPSVLTLIADSAADAVKRARREVRINGWTRQDGPMSYKATQVEPQ